MSHDHRLNSLRPAYSEQVVEQTYTRGNPHKGKSTRANHSRKPGVGAITGNTL